MQFPFPLVERVHARARYIRISVNAAGQVLLTIPARATKAEARAFLASRLDWIAEQRAKLAARSGAQQWRPRWQGEEQFPLRGVMTPLRWSRALVARPQLRFGSDGVTVFAASGTRPEHLTRALKQALLREARLEAEDLLNHEAHRLGLRWASLRIGDPRSQWGSCTRTGDISLSWRLLLAPPEVFRYVVVHELCHLPHPDHSPAFWAAVAAALPDFATARRWLKREGGSLHGWLPARTAAAGDEQGDLFG